MTKIDTSREAVERYLDAREKHLGTTSDQERIHSVGLPNCGIVTLTTTDIRALLTERDALQARAERAEALRAAATEVVKLLWESMGKQEDVGPHGGYIYMKLRAALAQLDAEPAGVSEPAGVNVKPLPRSNGDGGWVLSMDFLKSLDREVQAQGWDGLTAEVTEIIALSVEQRILATLEPGPTHREVWKQAKEAAADCVERKNTNNVGMVHPVAASDAAAIRAMEYPGDSQ